MSDISKLSAEVLVCGIKMFCASQRERRQLLCELLKKSESDERCVLCCVMLCDVCCV